MGHSGESDTVFRKHYESKHLLVDTANIFRKEAPRLEKTEVLSMHLRRDTNVPEVPESVLEAIVDNDTEIQHLLEARRQIKAQLGQIKGKPEQGYNEVAYKAALVCICRAMNRRRYILYKHGRKDFREQYFKNPELIRRQYPSAQPPRRVWRRELFDALYPKNEAKGSTAAAIEAVIAHCKCAQIKRKHCLVSICEGTSAVQARKRFCGGSKSKNPEEPLSVALITKAVYNVETGREE